jgi:putative transposase
VGQAIDEQSVAEQLVAQARAKGIELVGPDGLLTTLTKRVLEAEMSEHLGYDKHDPVGQNHGNSRNGVRSPCPVTSTPRSSPDCAQAAASADPGWIRSCCHCLPAA